MYQICICASWHFSLTRVFQIMVLKLSLWKQGGRDWGREAFPAAHFSQHRDTWMLRGFLCFSSWLQFPSRYVGLRGLEHEGKCKIPRMSGAALLYDVFNMMFSHASWSILSHVAPLLASLPLLCAQPSTYMSSCLREGSCFSPFQFSLLTVLPFPT